LAATLACAFLQGAKIRPTRMIGPSGGFQDESSPSGAWR
jgi:hypothetical protein